MIVKDEVVYFIEWVYYYFYFGFDDIEIYINRILDNFVEVFEFICKNNLLVSWYKVDWID